MVIQRHFLRKLKSNHNIQKLSIYGQCVCIILLCFSLLACSGNRRTGRQHLRSDIDTKLSEIEKRLEELYHRMSVIQITVDSHTRAIRTLENDAILPSEPPHVEQLKNNTEISVLTTPPKQKSKDAGSAEGYQGSRQQLSDQDDAATSLYQSALKLYRKKKYTEAQHMFLSFASTYSKHDLADNALYWAGECLYTQKKYTESIPIFKKITRIYPEGSKNPAALLKIGFAYISLKDYDNGRVYLKHVIKHYPFSVPGTKAETMLKKIQNY